VPDPDLGVLQNGANTVLAVPEAPWWSGESVTTAEPWGDPTQIWRRRIDAFQR
jgi:hypothetical protein